MVPPVLPTYNRAPIAFVEGQGPWLTAEDGERYLDLGAGIADCQLVEHRQGPISRRQHRVTPDTPEASRQDGPRGYR